MQKNILKISKYFLIIIFIITSFIFLAHYYYLSKGEDYYYRAIESKDISYLKRSSFYIEKSLKFYPYNRRALKLLKKIKRIK